MLIENLTLTINKKPLFFNFNYNFNEKGLYILIGPNGSGKTSLLKVISGLNKNYQGSISGLSTLKIKSSLDFFGFDPKISGEKNITALLKKDNVYKEYLDYLAENFEMKNYLRKQFSKMSFGMQKKCSLIAAITPKPDLLLLDEPFNGLDNTSQSFLIYTLEKDFVCKSKLVILALHQNSLTPSIQRSKIINLLT